MPTYLLLAACFNLETLPRIPVATNAIAQPLPLDSFATPPDGNDVDGNDLGSEWIAVPPERLDDLRGGFVMPSGLLMSFGIERAVYVDGQLVATARFNVPDIARITADQAKALAGIQETMLVQVGEGNTFVPNGMGGIVIQNTLDNLDIRALTTISVASSTLGMFQDL